MDPVALGVISSVVDNGANIGFGIYDRWKADQLNKQARSDWREQFDFNKDQFSYMQTQNALMRQREDNSIQRRMADLKAAGLHPTLAAGGQGAAAMPGNAQVGSSSRPSPVMSNAMVDLSFAQDKAALDMARSNVELNRALANKANAEAGSVGRLVSIADFEAWTNRMSLDEKRRMNRESTRVADETLTQVRREFEHSSRVDYAQLSLNRDAIELTEFIAQIDWILRKSGLDQEERRIDITRMLANTEDERVKAYIQSVEDEYKRLNLDRDKFTEEQMMNRHQRRLDTSSEIRGWLDSIIDGVVSFRQTTQNPGQYLRR